jgi:hypothetical protein
MLRALPLSGEDRIMSRFKDACTGIAMCAGFIGLVVVVAHFVAQREMANQYRGKSMAQWAAELETRADRTSAIEALGHFGPEARRWVPQLTAILKAADRDSRTARAAEQARTTAAANTRDSQYWLFGREGPAVLTEGQRQTWRRHHDQAFAAEQERARTAGEAAAENTRAALARVILQERIKAAEALGNIGPSARAAVSALRAAAAEGEPEPLRHAAADALKRIER